MAEWKGLDPGGTEQLWDPVVLIEVLNILKVNEPFSRGDPESPIYNDLEDEFPEITWKSIDANNSFRPVFRKTNPWEKLGLITSSTSDATVTPQGDELLAGEKTLAEVFIEATKNHAEPDKEHSFAMMCRAAIELPDHTFTLEDVEYAVSTTYADGTEALVEAIERLRAKKIKFPSGSRRRRTLRTFMDALVTAGALINVENGWALNDVDVACEIANIVQGQIAVSASDFVPLPLVPILGSGARIPLQNIKEILPGKRQTPTFDASGTIAKDPIQRALLLEKANSIHESLVEKCGEIIRSVGMVPVEDANTFDVAVIAKQVLIEVKSINEGNATSQLRKAIAQLPEYRWRHREVFNESAIFLIITSEDPAKYIDPEFLEYLSQDRKIKIFWLHQNNISDSSGLTLAEFLTHLR